MTWIPLLSAHINLHLGHLQYGEHVLLFGLMALWRLALCFFPRILQPSLSFRAIFLVRRVIIYMSNKYVIFNMSNNFILFFSFIVENCSKHSCRDLIVLNEVEYLQKLWELLFAHAEMILDCGSDQSFSEYIFWSGSFLSIISLSLFCSY